MENVIKITAVNYALSKISSVVHCMRAIMQCVLVYAVAYFATPVKVLYHWPERQANRLFK